MTTDQGETAYGRIFPPRQDWLDKAPHEEAIEPGLAIVDTHHHLWDWPERGRYMTEELLADTGDGHNVEATVFIECRFAYREDGPPEMRSVGEVAEVARIAADADRRFGTGTSVAAGIVGYADLATGDRVEPVLQALVEAGQGRFRGVRNSAGWHEDPIIGNNHHGAGPGHYLKPEFHAGLKRLTAMGLSLDALVYHHHHDDILALARACP
ncbi:MAG: amidohydrolase family protein, partial [Hyphomicrobiaceae bacterium]